MFKFVRMVKFNVRNFCEKKIAPEKRLEEYTYADLRDLLNKEEANIQNGILLIDKIPDNNYFGEIPIYIAPQGVFNNVRTCEFSAVIFSSFLTSTAYFKLFFSHWFFLPFYSIITIMTTLRFINARKMYNKYILRISLIDENKVRILYYNGVNEEVSVKNICISSDFLSHLSVFEGKKTKQKAAADSNNLNKNMNIAITIDTFKTCILVLRNSDMTPGKLKADNMAYIDNKILFGILNKKTKKLSLRE